MDETVRQFIDWQRFWSHVEKIPGGCWLWFGARNPKGYATFSIQRNDIRVGCGVHVFAYRKCIGDYPSEYEIDHTCRVRHCVNPAHLEAVPAVINNLRSNSPSSINSRVTHCRKAGHALVEGNIYWRPDGKKYRECLICRRDNTSFYNQQRKERVKR